ncbi:MAG TPA: TetR/AcrR family transcriptional regulator [Burkholderiaceae bacterium]|nr:TetR/AcrR family transcriptional regulator [Burkholderiaceae bacterium]HMY99314.1 TetR/AcrR family transcriptional regulator [Burkholderiaceae bacterium]HNG79925.1 TetR/AcrR family transcriptional regulator [Burkholderiaceae bacterium]
MKAKAEPKPKRRTRERILETSLQLFNTFGEPNVTTQLISDELEISPGNLYYHFRSKDEIIESLFGQFERRIETTLAAPQSRVPDVEDIWLFLHLVFEGIWEYRFLYRDLNELLSRNRLLETHFQRIVAHKIQTAQVICEGLVGTGDMSASTAEIHTLAVNMTLIATHWLSFEFVRQPRKAIDTDALARGAFHVMSLAAPYLQGRSRLLFERLATQYLER